MAVHVWAMWHLPTCHHNYHVSACYSSICWPCHHILSQSLSATCHRMGMPHHLYGCATCHHYNGDTWHSLIGPPVLSRSTSCMVNCHVSPCHVSCTNLPNHLQVCLPCYLYERTTCTVNFHVALYGLYNQHFFACFGKTNRSP
jgi:hypothetical protein